MDRKWIAVIVITLAVVVVGVIFAALYYGTYNNLVNLEVDVDQKWADVEAVLQRRFDLIPNVVDSAKLYIEYEGSILENITMLRSQWAQAQATGDENAVVDVSNDLDAGISQFIIVVEAYPDLKASGIVQDLIIELEGSENRIATERIRYNSAVSEYNSARRVFPANIWASGWGFEAREFFEASNDVYTPPSVQ
ncbi:MAG: LemA family protein [Candidatus Bathyarchaeota archaeon]|nr:MAG: LemA family protein [Candidatus Bathyarchaeota archaeon]